jgi:hypothetical protein
LLGEEEACDEVWLGTKSGEIFVVNVKHIRAREHAILLRSEVEEK